MARLLFSLLMCIPLRATIIDRLAVTVGTQVVTEQQLDEEIRVTAFLNHETISRTEESRRAAADHLVQQLLVKREMELSHYSLPASEDVARYLAQVKAGFSSPVSFASTLQQYGLTEATLEQHLALQLTTLRFIELRFRPNLDIANSDIQEAYNREVVAWKATHPGAVPPSFSVSREAIRTELVEQRTDRVLDAWLEETRKQVTIVYLDKSLR